MAVHIVTFGSFVTIRIFARTEHRGKLHNEVTIRIFARTEQVIENMKIEDRFVTIRIFARTELL